MGLLNTSVPTHCRLTLQGKGLLGERDNSYVCFLFLLKSEPLQFSSS